MGRKFLNMVLHEYCSRMYSLCRINLSTHLFYPTAKDASAAHADANARRNKKKHAWPSTISTCRRLPRTLVNFSTPPSTAAASNMCFFSLLPDLGETSVLGNLLDQEDDHGLYIMNNMDDNFEFFNYYKVWSHSGSWLLPFHRAKEYVPELGLCFGLQAPVTRQNRLRAFDLSSLYEWEYLDLLHDEQLPVGHALVNLGSGKFCIATTSMNAHQEVDEWENIRRLNGNGGMQTLLTGVEVVRCAHGLQLIHHKSQRCNFEDVSIHCVL
ncbi:hypothetical protein ZWY2020_039208 [Hordeum vulgare]|nr:hypothetical protein ZWY2020_039208 [Hordeum vulgare]